MDGPVSLRNTLQPIRHKLWFAAGKSSYYLIGWSVSREYVEISITSVLYLFSIFFLLLRELTETSLADFEINEKTRKSNSLYVLKISARSRHIRSSQSDVSWIFQQGEKFQLIVNLDGKCALVLRVQDHPFFEDVTSCNAFHIAEIQLAQPNMLRVQRFSGWLVRLGFCLDIHKMHQLRSGDWPRLMPLTDGMSNALQTRVIQLSWRTPALLHAFSPKRIGGGEARRVAHMLLVNLLAAVSHAARSLLAPMTLSAEQ